jgi:TPR repeat protein
MRVCQILIAGSLLLLPTSGNSRSDDDLIPKLERLAAQNNPEAIYHLGMAYQTGAGVTQNAAKALAEFRRAAALGDPLAAYKVGCAYDGQGGLLPRDPASALKYKLVAAHAGYALAQQEVAKLYAEQGDSEAAIAWLEKAAKQGWADALLAYASVHNGAEGIPPDPVKTAAYFKLYLDRVEASEKQKKWLRDFELRLSPEQIASVRELVLSYHAQPTNLTIRGLAGQEAAVHLVRSSG